MRSRSPIALAAALLAAPLLAAAPVVKPPTQPDFVIDAANRVGPCTSFTTEKDLIKALGTANVQRVQIDTGDEAPTEGTVLFPNTNRAAYILWHDDFELPKQIKISEPGTPWTTMEGVTVGTTLEDLERLNGRPFVIAAYDLNAGARTLSWEGGTFASELSLDLAPHATLSKEDLSSVGPHLTLLSSEPVVRKLHYTVRAMTITWE